MKKEKQVKGKRKPASVACQLAGMVIAIASCSSSPSSQAGGGATGGTPPGKVNIAFVCATPTLAFFAPIEQGAKDAATAMGVHLSYTGISSSQVTGPAMATVLKAAVSQHPTALIACNFFPSADDPVIRQAVSQGIPVFLTNSVGSAAADGALASFGQPDLVAGEKAADQMAAAGVKHPICVDDVPDNPNVAARCTGFASALASRGIHAKTINLPPSESENTTEILNAVKGELAADSNIDGILMLGNTQGPAAVQAVAQSGRTGKVKVGTFDLSSTVISDLRSGTMLFTVWQQPYLQGYLPVVAATHYNQYGMYPPGETSTGPVFVTKANVGKVAAAVAAGKG